MADDDDDLSERFLKANANADFMAHQLADVIRNCMRGAVANQSGSQAYKAAESLKFFLDLLVRSEGVRLYEVVRKAIEELEGQQPRVGSRECDVVNAAGAGTRFLIERSCSDGAARGRASRREDEFLSAIRLMEEMREYRRTKGT